MVLVQLKSDQNGIEIFSVLFFLLGLWVLKSDQNGIEMLSSGRGKMRNIRLKSDQNGIEINMHWKKLADLLLVKIRPKWD